MGTPRAQRPAQPRDFRDRAAWQGDDDPLGEFTAVAQAGGASVDRAQLLIAGPGELDLAVGVADGQPGLEPAVLALGQVLQAVPEESERVVFVSASSELLLLHAAADLVDDLGSKLDDVHAEPVVVAKRATGSATCRSATKHENRASHLRRRSMSAR